MAICQGKDAVLRFWWPFCTTEWNDFSKFGKGSHEEHICEIISNQATDIGGDVI